MKHLFEISIAEQYGVNAAIILENLGYWIRRNEANGTNFHDGTFWTFNSRRAYRELFPYMSERQISTAFDKLIDDGLVIVGDYNEDRRDRTLWYALTEKGKSILHFDEMQSAKTSNANSRNVTPLPNINAPINSFSVPPITPEGGKGKRNLVVGDGEGGIVFVPNDATPAEIRKHLMFAKFWNAYPRKVDRKGSEHAFLRIKNVGEVFPAIMDALERQKRSDQWTKDGGKFIPHPKTWINGERWNDELPKGRSDGDTYNVDAFFDRAITKSYQK